MASDTSLSGRELEAVRAAFAALRGLASRAEDVRDREALRDHARQLLLEPAEERLLSEREIDVLAHVATGQQNGEVAQALGLSSETVKSYLGAALVKLGARSRHEAVALAREAGLLP